MAALTDFIGLKKTSNLAAWPKSFDRNNRFPLDSTEQFETYAEAVTYSTTSAIAYVGQIIFVCWQDAAKTTPSLKHYKIVEVSAEFPDGLVEFGNGGGGSLSEYVKKSEITTTLADYIDGDDGLLAKEDNDTVTRKLYLSDFINGEVEDNAVYGINKYTDGKSASLSKLTLKSFLPAESTDEGKVIAVDSNGNYTLSEVEIKWKEYNE